MQPSKLIMLAVLAVLAVLAGADGPDSRPPGPDFVTCGCLDGTLVEFCGDDCQQVQLLCEQACRGYGSGTLFTACVPNGCP